MGSNLAINIALSGSLVVLWSLVNSLQIMAHFPLLVINYPTNTKVYYEMLLDVATFDIFPDEEIKRVIKEWFGIEDEEDTDGEKGEVEIEVEPDS